MSIADLKLPNKPFTEFNRVYNDYVLGRYFDHVLQVRAGEKFKGFHKKLAVSPTFTFDVESNELWVHSVRKAFNRGGKGAGSTEVDLQLWYEYDSVLPQGALGSSMSLGIGKVFPLAYKRDEERKLVSILRPLGYRLKSFAQTLKAKSIHVKRTKNLTFVYGEGELGVFELAFTLNGNLNVSKSMFDGLTGSELKEKVNKGEL